jgi:HlyD family secretion protein
MATLLPAGAFMERTGGDWIFVLAKDGKSALRRTIKIGRRNAEQVEILSGLALGEQAIISDYTGFERIDRIELKQQEPRNVEIGEYQQDLPHDRGRDSRTRRGVI